MEEQNYRKMYVENLRSLARKHGVPGADGMKKAELVEALKAVQVESAPVGQADRREVLFRRFTPGSGPVTDGRPEVAAGDRPDLIPQTGGADPETAAGKVGEPIGRHRSPAEVFKATVAGIDSDLSAAERKALETLRAAGWQVMVHAQVENAYVDTARRSYRVAGRYDLALTRKKLRR